MPQLEFFSSRFQYTFAAHAPTLTLRPGASVRVLCPDSDNMLSDGTPLPAAQRQRDASVVLEGNPVAGPIAIEGAEPGDCLTVHIDHIELDRATGQTGIAPGHGLLTERMQQGGSAEAVPKHLFRWSIDQAAGTATVINALGDRPIVVPLKPFVGCIGVCPPGDESVPTLYSGHFGGNMDLPIIRAGATVMLPVYRAGGLLMMGDVHAAQGDGEIIGGAIETSGRIDCTIGLLRQVNLPGPMVMDESHVAAVGAETELRASVQHAYANLLEWVVKEHGLNRWDAYNLISQTGSVMLGNLMAPPYPVAAIIPRALLPAKRPGS